jgi:glycosyltransferase involved in cell wall biosynthesis
MDAIDVCNPTAERPLISICIPTYNRPSLLRRTLLSINPGGEDLEIIVTDNSTDHQSRKIVENTLCSVPCSWRYHKNEPPVSPANNMNAGINLARGEYVYILHDDDYLLPGGLQKIRKTIQDNPTYPVLKFDVKVVNIRGKRIYRSFQPRLSHTDCYFEPQRALQKLLSNSSFVRQPSIIVKKLVYDQVGLWDDTKTPPNDTDMWMRVFSQYGIYYIPETISAYTVHTGAMTTGSFNYESLHILLGIFDDARQKGILPAQIFERGKSDFFHQWILASTYRYLVKGDFKTARQVMQLFHSPALQKLVTSTKWLPLKILFRMLLLV